MTLAETWRWLREDRERLRQVLAARGAGPRCVRCTPAYVCVALHRHAHWLFARGWRLPSRFVWQMNLWITGADISPMSRLGEGLLILHPFAVTITGNAGRNLSIEGWGGLGGGLGMEDIGAGPGVPVLGDDVSMARGAMVLGPVRIGDGARLGAGCTVVKDVPAGSEVTVMPVRVRRP